MATNRRPPDPSHGPWQDPLLEAGTREHYEDAALYDFEYRRRRADVNYYRRLAREFDSGKGVLELGCGTGRLLVPLARDGHRVVGIDLAAPMLARARARLERLGATAAARVTLLQADMRDFALRARFPLVVCPFNAFQHLYTHDDVAACLARVRAHLAPGGRFAFDVLMPDLHWLLRDPHKRWARTRFTHPTTGARFIYTTNQTYDPITQIAHIRIFYEPIPGPNGEPPAERYTRVVRLAHRQFFPAELVALVEHAGFTVERRCGGFDDDPLIEGSDSQVLVCRLSVDKP